MSKGDYARHARVWGLGGPDRSEEAGFYAGLAESYGKRVLSPMCADGEIARSLAGRGFAVTGFDLEPQMIMMAQEKNDDRDNPVFLVADILSTGLPENSFDFIFIGNGDIHHLADQDDVLKALTGIYKMLADGGGLALELFYPAAASWSSPPCRFDPPLLSDNSAVATWKVGATSYDAKTMRLRFLQEVFIQQDGEIESFRHDLELQLLKRAILLEILGIAGFNLVAEYGGYDRREWSSDSDQWLLLAEKSGN